MYNNKALACELLERNGPHRVNIYKVIGKMKKSMDVYFTLTQDVRLRNAFRCWRQKKKDEERFSNTSPGTINAYDEYLL